MLTPIWIKLGILLAGFIYAGFLPYSMEKSLESTPLNLKKQTLSQLSNKRFFGKKYLKGYTRYLFLTGILTYIFFWLLFQYYDLGAHERLMQYTNICFAAFTLLAFVPHSEQVFSTKKLLSSLLRINHNLLATTVFLGLSILIISFQWAVLEAFPLMGLSGMVIILGVLISVTLSILKFGVTGLTELVFINGIRIWSLFVTVFTVLN